MKVFATAALPGASFQALAREHELRVHGGPCPIPRNALLEGAEGLDALLVLLTDPVDEAVLDRAGPELKVVGTFSVGVDHIDIASCRRRGIRVCHTPGVLTEATADLTWALILGASRQLVPADRFVRAGRFQGWAHDLYVGKDLSGATLGVIGLGRIGQAVARRAGGFGMRILVTDERPCPEEGLVAGWTPVSLDELLREADVVTLHVPLTPKTRHLMSRARLLAMKPDAVLVNTSRGPVIDERALVEVMSNGHLFAAGLDVYEDEPRLTDGLCALDNVLLLPHLGSAAGATRARMADLVVDDLRAVLAGRRPSHEY